MPQDIVGDFTRSPTEHIINEIPQPFVVRSVVGLITLPYGGEPLTGVLFEIQGPGTDRKIRRCKTDEHGRFKMGRVPEGTYRFKATSNGFQSEMGTIIVSRKALKTNEIEITMPVGV
jgi:Carboxypeptidase regulatory-like domain